MWKYLLKKEFKQLLRDPGMPRIVMVFPLLIIFVFPFAANMEVRNIKLAVVDNDRSDQSQLLTENARRPVTSSCWTWLLHRKRLNALWTRAARMPS